MPRHAFHVNLPADQAEEALEAFATAHGLDDTAPGTAAQRAQRAFRKYFDNKTNNQRKNAAVEAAIDSHVRITIT